jgi:hypothetical protein
MPYYPGSGGGGGGHHLAEVQGFKSWSFDPSNMTSAAQAQTAGTLYVVRLLANADMVVSSGHIMASTGGTVTGAYAALYGANDALLQTSANASAQFGTGGMKTFTFASTDIPEGEFYLAYWQTGASPCSVLKGAGAATIAGGEWNVNTATTELRVATANTGLTTTAPATVGTRTAFGSGSIWVAVS